MCGILGFITDKPSVDNAKMLRDILLISSSRGTDATGIAIVNRTGEYRVVKEAIPSDKFVKKYYTELEPDVAKSKLVIAHTRLATQGHQRDNNNNHPIISDKYLMVHNGTCSTMERIKTYPYRGEVDSEILLSYIDCKGFSDGLKELKGSAAIAVLKNDEINTVYLWRHSNPLWVAYDQIKQCIFFASTEEILREGCANLLNIFTTFQIRQLAEHVLHKVSHSPLDIKIVEHIKPKGNVYTYYPRYAGQIRSKPWGMDWDDYDWEAERDKSGEPVVELTPNTSDTPPDNEVDPKEIALVYKSLCGLHWNADRKMFTNEAIDHSKKKNRYYFDGHSVDFVNWTKLAGGGHISIDRQLVKYYDKEKRSHFIIPFHDAISEGLIEFTTARSQL